MKFAKMGYYKLRLSSFQPAECGLLAIATIFQIGRDQLGAKSH